MQACWVDFGAGRGGEEGWGEGEDGAAVCGGAFGEDDDGAGGVERYEGGEGC